MTATTGANGWDDDGDCQNARHETLLEESRIAVTFTDEDRCSVATGEWLDPFTGDILTSARDLDVDHMVPLSNAHRSGAWAWDDARRRAYANDLSYANHLIAVTNSVNRAKSDQGPERWKPPDESYWCQYARDWANIKAAWGLSATQAEWDALLSMTATCDGQAPATATPPTATLAPSWMVYASCNEADRAGVPRQRGSSGNGQGFPANLVPTARDGDSDGVVCERTAAAAPTSAATPTAAGASTVYGSCEEAEQAGVPRQQGSQGAGYGFPAETIPSARDGDRDGVVCERTGGHGSHHRPYATRCRGLNRLRLMRGSGAGRCPPPAGKQRRRAGDSRPTSCLVPVTGTATASSASAERLPHNPYVGQVSPSTSSSPRSQV